MYPSAQNQPPPNPLYDKISPFEVYLVARDLCSLKNASWFNDPAYSNSLSVASQLLIKAADSLSYEINQKSLPAQFSAPDQTTPDPLQNAWSKLFPNRPQR